MGLTGLFLISFLVVHSGINACIWANDHGEMFNKAAHFMGASVVIRILEIGLFVGFIIHIVQGFILVAKNRSRRKIGYQVALGNRGSRWYSRSMGLLGTLILLFLVLHLYHFWTPSRLGGYFNIHELQPVAYENGKELHNLYAEMLQVFQGNSPVVLIYVLGCFSLSFHLMHGFQSAFRTLGLHNQRYVVIVKTVGTLYSIIIPLALAMMPLSIYFHWVN